jgi:hypothetical protein
VGSRSRATPLPQDDNHAEEIVIPCGASVWFWAYPGLAPWASLCRPSGAGLWRSLGRGFREGSVLGLWFSVLSWVALVEWVWRFFALRFTFPTFRTERERWGTPRFWLFDGLQGGLLIRSLV